VLQGPAAGRVMRFNYELLTCWLAGHVWQDGKRFWRWPILISARTLTV